MRESDPTQPASSSPYTHRRSRSESVTQRVNKTKLEQEVNQLCDTLFTTVESDLDLLHTKLSESSVQLEELEKSLPRLLETNKNITEKRRQAEAISKSSKADNSPFTEKLTKRAKKTLDAAIETKKSLLAKAKNFKDFFSNINSTEEIRNAFNLVKEEINKKIQEVEKERDEIKQLKEAPEERKTVSFNFTPNFSTSSSKEALDSKTAQDSTTEATEADRELQTAQKELGKIKSTELELRAKRIYLNTLKEMEEIIRPHNQKKESAQIIKLLELSHLTKQQIIERNEEYKENSRQDIKEKIEGKIQELKKSIKTEESKSAKKGMEVTVAFLTDILAQNYTRLEFCDAVKQHAEHQEKELIKEKEKTKANQSQMIAELKKEQERKKSEQAKKAAQNLTSEPLEAPAAQTVVTKNTEEEVEPTITTTQKSFVEPNFAVLSFKEYPQNIEEEENSQDNIDVNVSDDFLKFGTNSPLDEQRHLESAQAQFSQIVSFLNGIELETAEELQSSTDLLKSQEAYLEMAVDFSNYIFEIESFSDSLFSSDFIENQIEKLNRDKDETQLNNHKIELLNKIKESLSENDSVETVKKLKASLSRYRENQDERNNQLKKRIKTSKELLKSRKEKERKINQEISSKSMVVRFLNQSGKADQNVHVKIAAIKKFANEFDFDKKIAEKEAEIKKIKKAQTIEEKIYEPQLTIESQIQDADQLETYVVKLERIKAHADRDSIVKESTIELINTLINKADENSQEYDLLNKIKNGLGQGLNYNRFSKELQKHINEQSQKLQGLKQKERTTKRKEKQKRKEERQKKRAEQTQRDEQIQKIKSSFRAIFASFPAHTDNIQETIEESLTTSQEKTESTETSQTQEKLSSFNYSYTIEIPENILLTEENAEEDLEQEINWEEIEKLAQEHIAEVSTDAPPNIDFLKRGKDTQSYLELLLEIDREIKKFTEEARYQIGELKQVSEEKQKVLEESRQKFQKTSANKEKIKFEWKVIRAYNNYLDDLAEALKQEKALPTETRNAANTSIEKQAKKINDEFLKTFKDHTQDLSAEEISKELNSYIDAQQEQLRKLDRELTDSRHQAKEAEIEKETKTVEFLLSEMESKQTFDSLFNGSKHIKSFLTNNNHQGETAEKKLKAINSFRKSLEAEIQSTKEKNSEINRSREIIEETHQSTIKFNPLYQKLSVKFKKPNPNNEIQETEAENQSSNPLKEGLKKIQGNLPRDIDNLEDLKEKTKNALENLTKVKKDLRESGERINSLTKEKDKQLKEEEFKYHVLEKHLEEISTIEELIEQEWKNLKFDYQEKLYNCPEEEIETIKEDYKTESREIVRDFTREKIQKNDAKFYIKEYKEENKQAAKLTSNFLENCENEKFDLNQLKAEFLAYSEKLEKIKKAQRETKKQALQALADVAEKAGQIDEIANNSANEAVKKVMGLLFGEDLYEDDIKEELEIEWTEESVADTIHELKKTQNKIIKEMEAQKKINEQQEKLEKLRRLPEYENYKPKFRFSPKFDSQEFESENDFDRNTNITESTVPNLRKEQLKGIPQIEKEKTDLEKHVKKLYYIKNFLKEALESASTKEAQSKNNLDQEIDEIKDKIMGLQLEINTKNNTRQEIAVQISTVRTHLSELEKLKSEVKTKNEKKKEELKDSLKELTEQSSIEETQKSGEKYNKNFLKSTILTFLEKEDLEKNTKDFLNKIKIEELTCDEFIKEIDAYVEKQTEQNDRRSEKNKQIDRALNLNKNLIQEIREEHRELIEKNYEALRKSLEDRLHISETTKYFLEENKTLIKQLTESSTDDEPQEEYIYLLKIQSLELFQEIINEQIGETEKAIKELNALKVLEEDSYTSNITDYRPTVKDNLTPTDDSAENTTTAASDEINKSQIASERLDTGYFKKSSPIETLNHLKTLETELDLAFQQFDNEKKLLKEKTADDEEKVESLEHDIELNKGEYRHAMFRHNAISAHSKQLKEFSERALNEHKKLKQAHQEKLDKATSFKEVKSLREAYAEESKSKVNKLINSMVSESSSQADEPDEQKLQEAVNKLNQDISKKIDVDNLYALHVELDRHQKMINNPEPKHLKRKHERDEEELNYKKSQLTEIRNEHWRKLEGSLHPSITRLLTDSHHSNHALENDEQRIFAKFATLEAIKDRVENEKKKAKAAITDLNEYKAYTEMESYEPKLKFKPAPNFSELSKNSDNEPKESQEEITHEQLFKKLYDENFSLNFLGSEENTQAYREALLKAKKETDALLEHDLLTEKRESLDKKLEENKEEIEILESQFETAEKEIENFKLAIDAIKKHTQQIEEKLPGAKQRSHSYIEKWGKDNKEIDRQNSKEDVDKVRKTITEASVKTTSKLIEFYTNSASRIRTAKGAESGENKTKDGIVEQQILEFNHEFFEALSELSLSEQLDERKICIELEGYIERQQNEITDLNRKIKRIRSNQITLNSEREELDSKINELSSEYGKEFDLLLAKQQDVSRFVKNNKDRIKEIGEETNIPSYKVSTAAIQVFKEKLEEALKNLKDDPELAAQEKQVEEYISSRKAKKTFPNPNFDKWMHEVFEKCEWNFYQPEEKKRNTKPNARNINDTKNDETSSFSYGGARITLVENENGGHTITTDGFDILDPERGNVVALIYTHLLQMHHKQQFYSENIIAEKGEVSPEGKKRGFYLYRDADNKVYALVIHDDITHERLNLTEIADQNLLNQLKLPESGQKNTGDIPDKLLSLIIYNCKYEMQQGGINWANVRHQNFLLDNPKLSDEEIDEVLRIGLGDNNLDFNLFKTIPGFENVSTVQQFREKVNFISEAEKPEPRPANIKKNPKSQALYLQPEFIKRIIENDLVDEYRNSGCNFFCIKNQLNTYIRKEEGKRLPKAILEHVIKNEQVDIKTFLMTLLNEENNSDTARNLAQTIAGSKKIAQALHEKNLLKPMILELIKENKFTVAKELSAALSKIPENKRDSSSVEIAKHARTQFRAALRSNNKEAQKAYANIVANCYNLSDHSTQNPLYKTVFRLPKSPTKSIKKSTSFRLFKTIETVSPDTIKVFAANDHVKRLRKLNAKQSQPPIKTSKQPSGLFFNKHVESGGMPEKSPTMTRR